MHKTVAEHGPAHIIVDEELYEKMKIYKLKFRDFIFKNENELNSFLFINFHGKKVSSDLFNKSVKSIWNSAGIQSKIGATILRKKITSNIHDNYGIEEKAMTARLLVHRESTAAEHYIKKKRKLEIIKASNLAYKLLILMK